MHVGSFEGGCHVFADRLVEDLRRLSTSVVPRVAAARWGCVWNRWCTARRCQSQAPCLLACDSGCDSAHDYMGCAVGRGAGRLSLCTEGDYNARKQSMLGVARYQSEAEQTYWAILVYGIYMTTNGRRYSPKVQDTSTGSYRTEAVQELMQHCRNAVTGHSGSTRCLNALWRPQ